MQRNLTQPLHQPTSSTWVALTRCREETREEEECADACRGKHSLGEWDPSGVRCVIRANGTSKVHGGRYGGMCNGSGVDGDGIGGPRRAARPCDRDGSHRPKSAVWVRYACFALTYTGWTIGAYVTFSEGREISARGRKKRIRRPPGRRRDKDQHRLRRLVAVAPPLIGRTRLRRKWIGGGTWRALRLGSSLARGSRPCQLRCSLRRVGTATEHARRAAPRRWTTPCRPWPTHFTDEGLSERTVNNEGLTAAEACSSGMGSLRVGEASNPGHNAPVKWVSALAASALRYAMPGKMGFHGTHTAGFGAMDDGPQVEPFVLRVATANTTGWRPLQRFILTTNANVVFAQEHRLLPDAIPSASAWARKQGWKTVWAPARPGLGGGASAGTVIMARAYMGLRHPDRGNAIVSEAHAVAAVVEPPASRPFMGYAAYFHNGQGLSKTNLELAASIGAHWEAQADSSLQLMIGADFNMEPEVFARSGLSRRVWGRLVVPPTRRGTCRTRTKAATYDFFYMSAALAELVSEVATVEGTGIKTHAPTLATFHPRLAALKALMLRAPPNLPTEEVYGPRPPPPSWSGLQRAVEDLVGFARDGGKFEQVEQLLSDLYAIWMDTAEEELADITGTALPKSGCRGQGPKVAWRSILPETSKAPPPSGASALAWLMDIARDATRLSKPPNAHDELQIDDMINVLTTALDDNTMGKDALESDGTLGRMRDLLNEAGRLCRGGSGRRGEHWTAWAAGIEEYLDQLRRRHARCAASEASDMVKGWREWVREGFEAGGKNAHAYPRLPADGDPPRPPPHRGCRQPTPLPFWKPSGTSTQGRGPMMVTAGGTSAGSARHCRASRPRTSGMRRGSLRRRRPSRTTGCTSATTRCSATGRSRRWGHSSRCASSLGPSRGRRD